MPAFGITTSPRPARVDELLDSGLMSKLDQVDILSRKIFAGKIQGERRSKKRGISVEFADYRHYAHGDDLRFVDWNIDRKSTRLNSSHSQISYAVFCLKKKKTTKIGRTLHSRLQTRCECTATLQ